MADFLNRLGLKDSVLPVGFTFSFPCKQDSLDSVSWLIFDHYFETSNNFILLSGYTYHMDKRFHSKRSCW